MRMRIASILTILLLTACEQQPAQQQQAEQAAVQPISENEIGATQAELPPTDGEEVIRTGFIRTDVARWLKGMTKDSTLVIDLFPDARIILKVATRTVIQDSITVLDGWAQGNYPGAFSLYCTPSGIAGQIEQHAVTFSLLPVAKGVSRVQAIDRTLLRDEREPRVRKKARDGKPAADGDGQLRVLVLLPTPLHFYCTSKWPFDWKTLIQLMYNNNLNKVFKAMQPTGVTATVIVDCFDYKPVGGDFDDDLDFIQTSSTVAALRDQHKADMVSLVVPKGDICGLGFYNAPPVSANDADWAFSVVKSSCALGNYSFPHELGHNLGMQHDRITEGAASSAQCNYGSVFKVKYQMPWPMSFTYRSVMTYGSACDDCPRLGVYSNPLTINYGSYLTIGPMGADCDAPANNGNYKRANNRQQLIDAAPVVSNFR